MPDESNPKQVSWQSYSVYNLRAQRIIFNSYHEKGKTHPRRILNLNDEIVENRPLLNKKKVLFSKRMHHSRGTVRTIRNVFSKFLKPVALAIRAYHKLLENIFEIENRIENIYLVKKMVVEKLVQGDQQ